VGIFFSQNKLYLLAQKLCDIHHGAMCLVSNLKKAFFWCFVYRCMFFLHVLQVMDVGLCRLYVGTRAD